MTQKVGRRSDLPGPTALLPTLPVKIGPEERSRMGLEWQCASYAPDMLAAKKRQPVLRVCPNTNRDRESVLLMLLVHMARVQINYCIVFLNRRFLFFPRFLTATNGVFRESEVMFNDG